MPPSPWPGVIDATSLCVISQARFRGVVQADGGGLNSINRASRRGGAARPSTGKNPGEIAWAALERPEESAAPTAQG